MIAKKLTVLFFNIQYLCPECKFKHKSEPILFVPISTYGKPSL